MLNILVTWPKWLPRPYMVKTIKKSSYQEPEDRWPWILVCSIGDVWPTKFAQMMNLSQWPWDLICSIGDVGPTWFAQMMNLGWPWPTLWQGQFWFLMHIYGKNLEMLIFYKCYSRKNKTSEISLYIKYILIIYKLH